MNPFSSVPRPRRSKRNHGENNQIKKTDKRGEGDKTDKLKGSEKADRLKRSEKTDKLEARNQKYVTKQQTKKKCKQSESLRKQKKKERESQRRKEIKANPKKYEAYLEKERQRKREAVEVGKIKHVSNMSDREVRIQRKKVRERVRKYRMKIKQQEEPSPPQVDENELDTSNLSVEGTPDMEIAQQNDNTPAPSKQKISGDKVRIKNRVARKRHEDQVQAQILKLKRQIWRLQKSKYRKTSKLKSPQLTPKSATKKLCRNSNLAPKARRKLFEGLVLKTQLKESVKSLKSFKEKQILTRIVCGNVLKKYRQLNAMKDVFSLKQLRKGRKLKETSTQRLVYNRKNINRAAQSAVHDFLLSDEASTECPGKREGRRYDGKQRQRRYLKDSLKQLYKLFLAKSSKFFSYRTFCKYKPAWLVKPRLSGRDTCLCKVCENLKLLFHACKSTNVLNVDCVNDLVKLLCCNAPTTECQIRECSGCKDKTIPFLSTVDEAKPVIYCEWIVCSEERNSAKTKQDITVKITKKVSKDCTVADLKDRFQAKFIPYMQHVGRYEHQSKAWKNAVRNLKPTDMAIAMDWSMNYQCKYGRELQSVHFGASHAQIALHTGRVYLHGGDSHSFCSLSEITRHDPKAITAHLEPILNKYLSSNPQVNKLYLGSDGPVTQYRNRDLYYLVTQYLPALFPQILEIEWVFSEAGHGKGEPDGVGGTSKRMADSAVAHGHDIDNLEKLMAVLTERCPSVYYCIITDTDIQKVDSVQIPETKVINGTLKMHHWMWSKATRYQILFKTLKCVSCKGISACHHNSLDGSPWQIPRKAPVVTKPKKTRRTCTKKTKGTRKRN